jgi:hypothetical protein
LDPRCITAPHQLQIFFREALWHLIGFGGAHRQNLPIACANCAECLGRRVLTIPG